MLREVLGRFGRSLAKAAGICLVAALVLGMTFAQTTSAREFTITDLGTLGGVYSRASKINDAGQIIGTSKPAGSIYLYEQAFLWQDGNMINLGELAGQYYSRAADINEKGQVIFGSQSYPPLTQHTFNWENGEITELPLFGPTDINNVGQVVGIGRPGSGYYFRAAILENNVLTYLGLLKGNDSAAFAINDNGYVIGTSNSFGVQGFIKGRPYEWSYLMTDLGTLGGEICKPYAINNSNQVVGWCTTASGRKHAFLWDDGIMTDLGTLGGEESEAYAINESGQIVGMSYNSAGMRRSVLWENGTIHDLGVLGVGLESSAVDINESGQIVGWVSITVPSGHHRAVLWEKSGATYLGTLSNGWDSEPTDINNKGQIVGWSYLNKTEATHAVLWDTNLTPSCPSDIELDDEFDNSTHNVHVSWSAPSEGSTPAGYRVYRDGAVVCDVPHDDTVTRYTCDEAGLADCSNYCYTVVAYNSGGVESEGCNAPCIVTTDETAPSVLADLMATATSGSEIYLVWGASTDNCDDVSGLVYDIYRDGSYIGHVSGTSYTDTGLTDCTGYCYTVRAVDTTNNESADSNTACAKTFCKLDTGDGGFLPPVVCGDTTNMNNSRPVKFITMIDGMPVGSVGSLEANTMANPIIRVYKGNNTEISPAGASYFAEFGYTAAGEWHYNLSGLSEYLTPADGYISADGKSRLYPITIAALPNPVSGGTLENVEFNPVPTCTFYLEEKLNNGKNEK